MNNPTMEQSGVKYEISCRTPVAFYFNVGMIFMLALGIFVLNNYGDQPVLVIMLLIAQVIQMW